jgi:hypothetical protein
MTYEDYRLLRATCMRHGPMFDGPFARRLNRIEELLDQLSQLIVGPLSSGEILRQSVMIDAGIDLKTFSLGERRHCRALGF